MELEGIDRMRQVHAQSYRSSRIKGGAQPMNCCASCTARQGRRKKTNYRLASVGTFKEVFIAITRLFFRVIVNGVFLARKHSVIVFSILRDLYFPRRNIPYVKRKEQENFQVKGYQITNLSCRHIKITHGVRTKRLKSEVNWRR